MSRAPRAPASAKKAPLPARQQAFLRGVSAEHRAALLLLAKGYRTLARRWKSGAGEVDLVVRRGRTLVFVEVKARGTLDDAAYSVTPRQRQRIVAAANAWLMRQPRDATCNIRFDVVLVAPRRMPKHIAAAFDAGG